MFGGINRPVFHRGTRRVLAEVVVPFPIRRRSDRSGHEPTATVRTDIVQHLFNTCCAECAFIGADARLR